MDHFLTAMNALLDHQTLDQATAGGVFTQMLEGELNESQIGALLTALAMHHQTADELTGAARAMRERVTPVEYQRSPGSVLLDTCGTGGAPKTFNVSTAAAIILAGAVLSADSPVQRIQVAKHGNRSRTGRGSAEVLIELGVHVDADPSLQSRCLSDAGLCFCFAVNHHPAVKHAMPTRRSLGFPTIFNAIGPLTNPAHADHQLIGVFKDELVRPMAQTLVNLGIKRSMVVHATDGLDELTITAPTRVVHANDGKLTEELVDPSSLGLKPTPIENVHARDVAHSAQIIRDIVDGESSAFADMAMLTAAGGFVIAGVAQGFSQGLNIARESIQSGSAKRSLETLIKISNS
ncbi:MAG: anthranilate phosphoribosyltransferase [Phycisphaerales bacterium]